MTKKIPHELFEKGLIREDQFNKINLITSGKIVSVFYELQALLYLGVLLFTTGVGILIYINIGRIGHQIALLALVLITCGCFFYAFKKGMAYSHSSVKSVTPYFDYVVLLGALLFVSVAGYMQFQFGFLNENLELVTLLTSIFFFYIAYRFDHLGVLSLAITALASFCSVSISPQKWYSSTFTETASLHLVAITFGVMMACIALVLEKECIKKHFTFTYLNFSALMFFTGSITGLFISSWWLVYLLLIYAGCVFTYVIAVRKRSFLFLLYAFVSGFTGTTYFLGKIIFRDALQVWFLYSVFSCGGLVYFIIKYRTYFKQKP
jgi:hypothetical protein